MKYLMKNNTRKKLEEKENTASKDTNIVKEINTKDNDKFNSKWIREGRIFRKSSY